MTKSQRAIVAIGILLLALVSIPVAIVVRAMIADRHAVQAFRIKTDEKILLSKNSDEIERMLGVPAMDTRSDNSAQIGDFIFAYNGPCGDICRIEFKGGTAIHVEHYGK